MQDTKNAKEMKLKKMVLKDMQKMQHLVHGNVLEWKKVVQGIQVIGLLAYRRKERKEMHLRDMQKMQLKDAQMMMGLKNMKMLEM